MPITLNDEVDFSTAFRFPIVGAVAVDGKLNIDIVLRHTTLEVVDFLDHIENIIGGQKTADIAADMELNESTVRTKLNRGRAKLRDFLTREGHNEKDEKGGAAWNTTSMI